uniref:SWIM-type domain-containing protein n=1 Tax=Tanacetum cinerariifolium TaxID=118510 RepID=A0A699HM74_TANCI|nr:hypothetical protein [Tanacetum cinerariifolium]
MYKMVTFMVDLYHDGLFASNPLRSLAGEHRVIKDINFEGMTYDNFFLVMRRLVLEKPLSFFYVLPGLLMNIGLRPICNDEQLNDFVQALFENDCYLDMYTEHQGYDVLEMINDDRHCEDKSDSDFEDVTKGDNLDDVKDIVDFQTKGEDNVNIPRLSIDDPWLNKLVGKGRFVGEMEDPIPGLKGRFFVEQNDPDENFIEPKRDVSAGKCAGKRGKKQVQINDSLDKDKGKVGEGSSHKDFGKGSTGGSSDKGKGKLAGWLEGCRKSIGLDGCYLTHICKGQLLTAIGRDANNQMFPVAWAVVGVENKNNWCWFLSLLSDDLNLNDGAGLTVISYGHKSIGSVLDTSMPTSRKNRVEIKALDEKAYTWLVDHDPNTWCRVYFEVDRSCAAFERGISESFNSKILSARGKPIITMLEDIRVYIMQRVWFLNKTAMELNHTITPFSRRHLKFIKIRQRKWVVYASGFQEVEVRRQDEAFGVNIHLKKCACKMWELTGLPCMHAVARPVPDTKLWKKSDIPKPGERKLPGRPRKRRIRHPSEYDNEIKSSSGNKRKEPPVKKKSSQVNKASGSKSNLTPEEHAEIMDKEAFTDLVRKDAENKAKEDEMWRQTYEEKKYWEEYASEFKDWEFREEQENRIGITLYVDDEHIKGNTEPVNPAEQTHVITSASSAPVDEQTKTSQDPSTEKAGSSADPKKKANKRKKKADSEQPLPFRIYHKNRGRSERIANL